MVEKMEINLNETNDKIESDSEMTNALNNSMKVSQIKSTTTDDLRQQQTGDSPVRETIQRIIDEIINNKLDCKLLTDTSASSAVYQEERASTETAFNESDEANGMEDKLANDCNSTSNQNSTNDSNLKEEVAENGTSLNNLEAQN